MAMPQQAKRLDLALKPLAILSIAADKLNRNIPVHVLIGGQIHHGHASLTQVTLEAIATSYGFFSFLHSCLVSLVRVQRQSLLLEHGELAWEAGNSHSFPVPSKNG